jgi:excisionase family DNA binding protein
MEERYLSLSEAADALDISERTAYRWIKSGKLRAYKPGRDYRIPESAIKEAIEMSEISPKALRRSSLEPSLFNGLEDERREDRRAVGAREAIEFARRFTRLYENLNAIRDCMDEYREAWEARLADGDFDKATIEEGGRALKAFWPAVVTAVEAETAELDRIGVQPEEIEEKSVLLPVMDRFQALCAKVNDTYREQFLNAAAPNVYPFPQRKAS